MPITKNEFGTFRFKDANKQIIHHINLPAIVWSDGTKEWYKNGVIHRDGGAAIEYSDGSKAWYYKGELCYTEQDYNILRELKQNEE